MKKFKKRTLAGAALALGLIVPQVAPTVSYADFNEDIVKLRILGTTDIHTNLVNYDYYQDKTVQNFGLSKTASLIKQAREEQPNTLLVDNGDIIQGNPLGDYTARVAPLKEGEVHPVFDVMNLLKYDAATPGNHEFNYGLDFLEQSSKDAQFPYVNANVYHDDKDNDPTNDKFYFSPYQMLERTVTDEDGEKHTIKVGVTGFVPPQILSWDSSHLQGEVVVKDIVESAKAIVPKMKEEGADVIVVLSHSGIDYSGYKEGMENAAYYLTEVEGIDAVVTGHQHNKFPAINGAKQDFPDSEEKKIDNATGTINGVPVTMPGSWGDHLGQIDLTIEKTDGKWAVKQSAATIKPIVGTDGKPTVESDKEIEAAVKERHEGTIKYVNGPVGTTTAPINSYFALVQDDPSVQIVNQAQKWYVEKSLKGTQYENLPILSSAAPFKAGGRNGADYYTDIPAGTIAIKNVADLYLYPNTVYALKLTGKEIKEWLEWSAGQFNQIDPKKTEEQSLVNGNFPTYNFDIIDGITYEIDVTEPAKYDRNAAIVDEKANRVKNIQFEGKALKDDQEFVVVTNNYRAGTSNLVNPKGKNTILAAPDENRQVIIDYITETKTINPAADQNWKLTPIKGDVKVTFESSPKAQNYLASNKHIQYQETLSTGFAKYTVDLSPKQVEKKPFKDVPTAHWAFDYITALQEAGIIKGQTEELFNPQGNITRGQFASMLVRSLNIKAEGTSKFKDVPAYLQADVAAAQEAGITTGRTNDTFAPFASITREQMAAMIMRAYEYKTGSEYKTKQPAPYQDQESVQGWAKDYVNAAYELKFMTGQGSAFNPKSKSNRAQASKVVYYLNK
ncbi:bifunctional 2',3'-cyclic-nucleotide 2'-phosphodiesterase/3'-nucleotidase [Bacillus sp. CGMCC 1.16541]|uniref:bifunctional 2',3'-cyclic-nucleotide 2'-phosphodiesterase/3'-nucleotidase n=1 Tax=Bacillus sp. CGMCC 1.16541 TaxID=2185143 RepID=UPI000D73F22A|nr:bifunctional 2',3'-cyclic-nucleotide 2'-phosphodiesterase/3'-nucleotidase [Bacillus sp. CGMCC 1.16541]